MGTEYYILIAGYILGFYMSWNIGANDVANSMASAVGAKAITIRQAIFIAGILNITGAVFIGSHVTNTIRKGIVSTDILADPHIALIGAFSALLAASLWISFATWKSLPVSTTHSIVGAMIGFGIMAGGFSVINFGKLGAVVLSWVISQQFPLQNDLTYSNYYKLPKIVYDENFNSLILQQKIYLRKTNNINMLDFRFVNLFKQNTVISTG